MGSATEIIRPQFSSVCSVTGDDTNPIGANFISFMIYYSHKTHRSHGADFIGLNRSLSRLSAKDFPDEGKL
jgi:hypothetical protein